MTLQQKPLTPDESPKIWFIELINERTRNVHKAVPLAKQYIPDPNFDDGIHLLTANSGDYYVSMDDSFRTNLGPGTVLATNLIEVRKRKSLGDKVSFYISPKATVEVIGPNASIELKKAYQDVLNGRIPTFGKAVSPQPKAVKSPAKANPKTYIGELLRKFPTPTPKRDGFWISEDAWKQIVHSVSRKKQVLLYGDSGTGKTEICQLIAKLLTGREVKTHDMSTKQDAVASMIGSHRYDAAKGGSYFDRARFVDDIQSEGLVLLDELNRSPYTATNLLFPTLDNRREFYLDYATGDQERVVKVNENCVFIATANIGPSFSGTVPIDPALKSRFKTIQLTYPPQKDEVELLMLKSGITEREAKSIVQVATSIRELYKTGDLSESVSMRHTYEAAGMVKDGFELHEALQFAFTGQYMNDELKLVMDLITKH